MTEPALREPAVRVLDAADGPAYRAARLAALRADPFAFVTTAAEFAARSLEDVAARLAPTENALTYGAFVEGELVGLLTLAREERPTVRHRANIFGVSVAPQARRRGVGEALLRAALAQARAWEGVTSLHLAVMETQVAARRLYERHGFVRWGRQPDAVQHAGRSLAEDWLTLDWR